MLTLQGKQPVILPAKFVYSIIAKELQFGLASYGELQASPQIKWEKHKQKEEVRVWGTAVNENLLEESMSPG